ncbi:MAG: mercuric transporter MerT family protein [Acidiferrobacterales bacterium]
MPQDKISTGSLAAGGIAAMLASTCCLGPRLLVPVDIGGAWVSGLTAPEPFRPWFRNVALAALCLACRRIVRPPAACPPGEGCADPAMRRVCPDGIN